MDLKKAEENLGKFFDLKKVHKVAKDEASRVKSELDFAYSEFAGELEGLGLDNYSGKLGIFSFRYEEGALTPKTIEDKQAFFKYLLGKYGEEYAWNLVSFNSRTLNSFFKEEHKLAEEEKIFDLEIPGITKGESHLKFYLRKKGEK